MERAARGDVEIAYEVEGQGEPLVLLMGLGGDHHAWDLLRPLLRRRHRLVLVDNRDAGASSEASAPIHAPLRSSTSTATLPPLCHGAAPSRLPPA